MTHSQNACSLKIQCSQCYQGELQCVWWCSDFWFKMHRIGSSLYPGSIPSHSRANYSRQGHSGREKPINKDGEMLSYWLYSTWIRKMSLKVTRKVKFIESVGTLADARGRGLGLGRGNEDFDGDRVSVSGRWKIQGMDDGERYTICECPQCHWTIVKYG